MGAKELSQLNIRSSLYSQNIEVTESLLINKSIQEHPSFPLLFDPQTSGGLLAGLCPKALEQLKQRDDVEYYVIGKITEDNTAWDLVMH